MLSVVYAAVALVNLQGVPLLLSILVSAAGIAAAGAFAYRIGRNLDDGLKRLAEILLDMENGTDDTSVAGMRAHDEFGEVARSFHDGRRKSASGES